MTLSRGYKVNPDLFCYICDEVTSPNNRKHINNFVSKAYDASFLLIRTDRVNPSYWLQKTVGGTYFSGLGVLELHLSLAFRLFGVSHTITSTTDTSAWLTFPTLTRRNENLWNILLSIQLYRSESHSNEISIQRLQTLYVPWLLKNWTIMMQMISPI